ncbi:MAG: type II secretion system protein N [Gammaproteobacteria bacterium]|nr:type II secretion system protein N [Gammaproteobacteria bacterium]
MRLSWRLLLAGLLVYLLFILISFPAQRGARFLQQQVDGLVLQAVSGTLFSGQAGRLEVQGIDLGSVNWSFRPVALLTGRLEYRLDFAGPLFTGGGFAGLGLSGAVYGRELETALQPDPLVNHFSPLPIQTAGAVRVRAERFKLVDGFPQDLSGQVDWTNARILDPISLELGDVALVLNSAGDEITGRISNTGETGLAGEISLTPTRDYRLDLQLAPGPDTPAEVVDGLADFAEARPGGVYRITDAGRF